MLRVAGSEVSTDGENARGGHESLKMQAKVAVQESGKVNEYRKCWAPWRTHLRLELMNYDLPSS